MTATPTQALVPNGEPTPPPTPAPTPAPQEPQKAVVNRAPPPAPDEGGALNSFASANNFGVAQRMAAALSESTLVPKEYQDNIPNCLIAIELANRIGASVFAVMQNMDIIHGRPSWRATFLIATVNASRDFSPLRFRWVGTEGTDGWGCRAVAKDRDGEECLGALISIKMAKAEGWYSRAGSKWQTMPEQMLMYRAAGFWTRIYAPEKTLGLRTSDESEDIGPAGTIDVQSVGTGPAPLPDVEQGRRMSLSRSAQQQEAPRTVTVDTAAATKPEAVAATQAEASAEPATKKAAAKARPAQQEIVAPVVTKVSDREPGDDEEDKGDAPGPDEFPPWMKGGK